MQALLNTICPILVWVIAAFQLVMLLSFMKKYGKTKNPLFLCSGLVAFGLFYDALILSFGTFMQEGSLLSGLSQVRYISHGALIPLLLPICAYALNFKKTGKLVTWIITAALMAVGIGSGIATVMIPENFGVLRYACDNAPGATPTWAVLVSGVLLAVGMIIPVIIAGIIVWIKQKTPSLFLAGALMFAFSGVGAAFGDFMFFISMFGEVCMITFFMVYANFNEKKKSVA